MAGARRPQGRIFWAGLILLAFSMTAVSISQAVLNFFGQSTHILAEHKGIDDILYPPLKICFSQWLAWLNWTSAIEMNFTKPEILFAMSYLTQVYSEEHFDLDQIEKSFSEKLTLNDMTSIQQFYKSVAYKRTNIMQNLDDKSPEYDIVFHHFNVGSSQKPRYILCYRFSEDQIKMNIQQMFSKRKGKPRKKQSSDGITFVLFSHDLPATNDEMKKWLTEDEYKIYTRYYKFFPLMVLFNDYDLNGKLIFDRFTKFVKITAEVSLWKNSAETPCQEGRQWIEGNVTCLEKCQDKFSAKSESDTILNLTEKIFVDRNDIYFKDLDGKSDEWIPSAKKPSVHRIVKLTGTEEEMAQAHDECVQKCSLEVGCEVWSYTITCIDLPPFETKSYLLVYPSNVEVMKEVDLQTWENFVASIGGLLGIWTGASILTLMQICYLFFYQGRVHSS